MDETPSRMGENHPLPGPAEIFTVKAFLGQRVERKLEQKANAFGTTLLAVSCLITTEKCWPQAENSRLLKAKKALAASTALSESLRFPAMKEWFWSLIKHVLGVRTLVFQASSRKRTDLGQKALGCKMVLHL